MQQTLMDEKLIDKIKYYFEEVGGGYIPIDVCVVK